MVAENFKNKPKNMRVYLLGQGIMRNPTAWNIWRDLGWAAFIKTVEESDYFALAEKALVQASLLRPHSPQGYIECGMVSLASYKRRVDSKGKGPWKEAFNYGLTLNPGLSSLVVDQVLLYLGPQGAKELKEIIPREAQTYYLTGVHLVKQGVLKEGVDFINEGEHFREKEIDRLWAEASPDRDESQAKRNKTLEEILRLDPAHPKTLLNQGKVIEALRSQDRRQGHLGELADRKALSWNLKILEERKKGSPEEIAYLLGRLAEEEGDLRNARFQFQRALQIKAQYFPVWVRLERVLTKTQRNAGDRIELENLQKKIQFFEMPQVAGDAWKLSGYFQGYPYWKVPFRTGQKKGKVIMDFSAEMVGGWRLLLDGRFVSAWAGGRYMGEKKMVIPEGEHEFWLIGYNETDIKKPDQLPFKLTLTFN